MRPQARAVALTASLAALAAQAYILPHWSILRRLAERREELQLTNVQIQGSFSFHGAAAREAAAALGLPPERPEVQADGAVFLKVPGRCRIQVQPPEADRRLAVTTAHGRERTEGTPIAALRVALEQLCPLLASRSSSEGETRAALESHLSALGVEYKRTSLARFGGQVAYVLGEAAEGKPQLWVYKDRFQPARIRFTDAQGTAWDVRFLGFAAPATGEWFPRTLEVFRAGELSARFTALKADGRSKLDDKLF